MQLSKIEKIEPSKHNGLVYNIEVEEDHSYITHGFVVHNCQPSASKDIYFDRESLDRMERKTPIKVSNGFRMYSTFNPSHRYGGGNDIAGGVGLDSSASVFIDFSTIPAQVVGVYDNNLIKPESFGDEIYRQSEFFGKCLVAPERNYGTEAILRLKQLGARIFSQQRKDAVISNRTVTEYGWHTNQLTKPKMLSAFGKAIEDGLISLNDEKLIEDSKSYTRNDLIENIKDPRLTTRHFDLLMAGAIAWQMKDYAMVVEDTGSGIGDYVTRLKRRKQIQEIKRRGVRKLM